MKKHIPQCSYNGSSTLQSTIKCLVVQLKRVVQQFRDMLSAGDCLFPADIQLTCQG
jgi:hypothetical protein